jgi:hypothetical protein
LAIISAVWVTAFLAASPLHDAESAVWVTAGLIAVNFAVSLWALGHRMRLEDILNLAQVPLFAVLFFQVHAALGPQHYRYDNPPVAFDWLQFTGAHLLRAADVLDVLDDFRIDIQNVKHASTLTGVLLVTFHFMVDVFLIAVLFRGGRRLWQNSVRLFTRAVLGNRGAGREARVSRALGRGLGHVRAACLLACIFLCIRHAVLHDWRFEDYIAWPLDNLVRLADFPDAMQIFGWRLHAVKPDSRTATLAVAFRFFAGLYLAGWLNLFGLRVLGRRALRTMDDFIRDLSDLLVPLRETTAKILGEIGAPARAALPALIEAAADTDADVREAAADAVIRIEPNWTSDPAGIAALPGLLARLTDATPEARAAAASILGQIGPSAVAVVPALIQLTADAEPGPRDSAVWALDQINANWTSDPSVQATIHKLIYHLSDSNPYLRTAVLKVLGRLGSAGMAADAAVEGALWDGDPDVRAAATEALLKIRGVRP